MLLIGVYYAALIVLFGAEITHVTSRHRLREGIAGAKHVGSWSLYRSVSDRANRVLRQLTPTAHKLRGGAECRPPLDLTPLMGKRT